MSDVIAKLQAKCGATPDGSWGPATFKAASAHFGLSHNRAVHFFAQTCHETGGFNVFAENLNYSAQGLMSTFGKYFTTLVMAEAYAHVPVKIANKVYANRNGNGDEASGDGWKYRGRGALQTTGKANYDALAAHLNRPDIMTNPDIVATELAFEAAIFFFDSNHVWPLCDGGIGSSNIIAVTKKVNGGTIGLAERTQLTQKFSTW
jgi:putative chitinase